MTDTQDSTDTPFDPADHNVDVVLEYVKEHPDEAERIVLAEVDGKNRSTLIEALAALNADADDGDGETEGDDDATDGPTLPRPDDETPPDDEPAERTPRAGTHVLEVGESPAIVARRLLGRGSYGNQIVRANPGVKWKPGTEIFIPEVD